MIKLESAPIIEKTEELCQAILNQSAFKELKDMIQSFINDPQTIAQYESFMDMQQRLQRKERQGQELLPEEIRQYEQEEGALYANSTARQFIYAQQEFTKLHDLVSNYVVKTIQLDRLPNEEELSEGSGGCGCGGNCGCGGGHH